MTDDKYFIQGQNGDLIRFDLIQRIKIDKKDPNNQVIFAETSDNEKFIIYATDSSKDLDKKYAYLLRCIDVI